MITRIAAKVHTLLLDEKGVTAIEYGLIAGLIAVATVTVLGTVGNDLTGVFNKVATNLGTAAN
jgi:pilus assembly protein Flp/PilA